MSEKTHQAKIIKELESKGYYVLKLMKTNKNGIPDLLALKEKEIYFIEVKGKKTPVSELQKYRIKELQKYGFKAEINREL
jgi:VRR-NUC domain.